MVFLLLNAFAMEPGEVVDAFHTAAAEADLDAYFGCMTEDAVFLGTDASERWDKAAFRAFATPYFSEAPAWVYTPVSRNLEVRGTLAWFDETLQHDRYGTVRGSGVLVRTGKRWQISQYVLSFPLPNAIAADVVRWSQHAPAPFSAEQLATSLVSGLSLTWRVHHSGNTRLERWTFTTDENTVSYEVETLDSEGTVLERAPGATQTWKALEEQTIHRLAEASMSREHAGTPFGPMLLLQYRVGETSYWYSPSHPGPPLRVTGPDEERILIARHLPDAE